MGDEPPAVPAGMFPVPFREGLGGRITQALKSKMEEWKPLPRDVQPQPVSLW